MKRALFVILATLGVGAIIVGVSMMSGSLFHPGMRTSPALITQTDLGTNSKQGQYIGLTVDELSQKLGGYRFKEHMLHRGLYTTYVEHLGGAVGVFIVEARVGADGKIVETKVKYD